MRKMKKINGYLVVKFNDRELREYEGTALGKYGVIDAELYTGTLEVDRGAMEYHNADSIEEAVELARGLESELDTEEPEVKVTLIKGADEIADIVSAQCPPVVPENCDAFSCRECWLAWLTPGMRRRRSSQGQRADIVPRRCRRSRPPP